MEEQIRSRRKKVIRDALVIMISVFVAIVIYQSDSIRNYIYSLSDISAYAAMFLIGILFSSTFTVAIASSFFLFFAQTFNPLTIALVGGLGAFAGDTFIFKFLKDDLVADFEYLEKYIPKHTAKRIIHSKLIFWLAPLLAALMIASPLPDEVGLLVLASIKLKYHHFFLVSYALNTVSIFVLTLVWSIFH